MTAHKQLANNNGTPPNKPSPPVRFVRPTHRYPNNKAKPPDRHDPHHHSSTPKRQATANDSCFNCGKTGHFANKCPLPPKQKKDYIRAARSTVHGGEEGDAEDEYRVSEADDEREEDGEASTPQSEQGYSEIEVAASEFYEEYDDNDNQNAERSAAMAIVSPKERIAINDSKSDSPDALAASIVGPKPEGRAEKDNWRFRI